MAQTVEAVLRDASLYSDDQLYHVIGLPANAITVAAGILAEIGEPLGALIADKDEVTLVIPAEAVAEFDRRMPQARRSATNYRLITLDLPLEPTLVGLMARLSTALAEAGVSILPLAAYSRDHILVPAEQFDKAITALQQLKRSAG